MHLIQRDHNHRNNHLYCDLDSDNQQQSCQSDCSSQSDAASCKPSSLLFSYYTSTVYPALRYTPCRAGFGIERFAFANFLEFHIEIAANTAIYFSFNETSRVSPLLCKRVMPNFVRIQKRRRSMHLPTRGSRQPQSDKRKRPTPQYGQPNGNKSSPFVEIRPNKP